MFKRERLIGLSLFLSLCSGVDAQVPKLIVRDGEQVLINVSLSEDPNWIMRWNHSVTGIVVSDYYRFEDAQMLLTDTHTPSFDAGLGHIPGRGKQVSDGQNGYFILDIDEAVAGGAYALRVGSSRVNHRIIHAGQLYSLSELAPNKRVIIEIQD